MSEFSRGQRVAEEIQKVISSALVTEVSDERLRNVTIADVRVSPDLRHARIFWLPLIDTDRAPRPRRRLQGALDTATPFLRGHLARAMTLRFVPELTFVFDEATETGRSMEELLDRLRESGGGDAETGITEGEDP